MKALIALPVLNEEDVLRGTVEKLRRFARESLPEWETVIVVADNGSTDATEAIGRRLAAGLPDVRYFRLAKRGKGLAIAAAWRSEAADVYAFMDADLATDLAALPPLLAGVRRGAGLAVGSRYGNGSRVERSALRKALSLGYRLFLRLAFGTRLADAPCGFKAASPEVVAAVLPRVRNLRWFFDTEFAVRAERAGYRIDEIPVVWRELRPAGRKSRVRIAALVAEYVREVMRLRKDLTGGSPERQDDVLEVRSFRDDRRRDAVIVVAAAFALAALTSVPASFALWYARANGLEWTGRIQLSPGDLAVYLSSIAQAARGQVLLANLATTERLVPVPNAVWSAAGLIARWTGLAPLGAYQALRLLLIPAFAFVVWAALLHFVASRRARIVAFLLLLFGSGIGAFFASFLHAASPRPGAFEWPTDLWIGESNAFLSALYSPHFLASWALLVAALLWLSRAYASGKRSDAAFAGAAALLLFSFHPFYALTLYAVGAAWLALRIRREGAARLRSLLAIYAAFAVIPSPAVACYFWLAKFTANGAFMLGSNLLWTPSPFYVLVGLGGFALLAPFGWRHVRLKGGEAATRADELALWAAVTLVLLYVPITFQRRLIEGLEFPLAALAGMAIVGFERRLKRMARIGKWFSSASGALVLIAIFLPSTFYALAAPIQIFASPETRRMFFFSADKSAALAWIRKETPVDAVVLSTGDAGNDILGWGERRAYAGHWAATLDLPRKNREIAAFYGTTMPTERAAFLRKNGIGYVFEGPAERALGGGLDTDLGLDTVFRQGDYAIYKPRQ